MKEKFTGLLKEEILVGVAGVFILAGLLIFLGSNWKTQPVFGWTDPTTTPPSAQKPTPILESGNQTRSGNLTIDNHLTVSGNVSLTGNWLLFPNLSGARAIISDEGNYILVGSSSNRYFVFFTDGTYASRMAIGAPAPIDPAQNLRIAGTAQFTGAATTTGILTLNNRANACKLVYYTGTSGDTNCGSDHWWVAVRNTSGVLVNSVPPPTPGYMICCKKY